ncbi:MAG: coagulation factor 5/8 type domain-containing protein [Terracidiphilus sp.]
MSGSFRAGQSGVFPGTALLRFARGLGLLVAFAAPMMAAGAPKPDFGPNVHIFSPSMPAAAIQSEIDKVYAAQRDSEFGSARNALFFLPGEYKVDVPVGFYTEVMGLGATPDSVHIAGNVHADASRPHDNATCTFWRGIEGLSVTPAGGTLRWAVSQSAPFRRMHVRGSMVLHQNRGWVSGGWIADSLVDGNVDSGTQQQWIARNSQWGSWSGAEWNMVFVGDLSPPAGEWPSPPYTKVAQTPVAREKPFLAVDGQGNYSVRVPALRRASAGIGWRGGSTPGISIPLSRFFIAHPGDTAGQINAQLALGKNLLFTPGIYDLASAIRVTRPNTVVLGLGFATLRPVTGKPAITTADADGIVLAGLLIDAGALRSPVLLRVGAPGSHASHAKNPITLSDIFFRVGGAGVGRAGVNLEIDSNDTLVDHTWIWRADHGSGVGWTLNTSENGLVVNGENVTAYGLFVEHLQQFQVLWRGNGGRVYFYQSEIPYDAPDQASFRSAPGVNGWASYKLADSVTSHEAWGLGIYSVFRRPGVVLDRAIETPRSPGVRFHHVVAIALDNLGEIVHVIDNAGRPSFPGAHRVSMLNEFP